MTGNFRMGDVHGPVGAIGPHASGSVSTGGPPDPRLAELQRRLVELEALVERHAAELDDGDAARYAVAEAEKEARAASPEPLKLRALLASIAGAASNVSAVTTAVSGIRALLGGAA